MDIVKDLEALMNRKQSKSWWQTKWKVKAENALKSGKWNFQAKTY